VKALLRLAVLYNIPTASNRAAADFLIERKKGEKEPPILGAGEFFNEEELLYAFPASAQIQALQPARLMFLSADELYALVRDFPQIKPNLTHTQEGKALARREQFRWLNGEEIIHHIARKVHPGHWSPVTRRCSATRRASGPSRP